jgi:septal ring factor EnvC (AmiA/AmiB activator)
MEELELERRGRQEILRRAEGLEREQTEASGLQQEAERLRQERQRLAEELEKGREERAQMQRLADQQEQELARLERELRRSQAGPDRRKRSAAPGRAAESGAGRPWWRRPLPLAGLLVGVLITWFISLAVALSILTP